MISVLLVHDSTELIDAARSYLEKMGEVRIDTVTSTKQALEFAKNRQYDVIVSYYRLPEINGIEFLADLSGIQLLRYLKTQGVATPFILYSRDQDRMVIQDLNFASEVPLSRGDPRPVLTEIRDVVKQAVLRKRAEHDLTAKSELLSGILSATPFAICQMRDRKIEWANSTLCRMVGCAAGELAGKGVETLFPDRTCYDKTERELAIRLDDQGWGQADSSILRSGGGTIACRIRARKTDPSDPSRGVIWVIEDTSEHRALEDALRENEIRYREILQSTGALVMRVDTNGAITFFNKAAQAFFGYSLPEIQGRQLAGTLIPDNPRAGKEISSLLTDPGLVHEGTALRINEMRVRSGEPVWIAWIHKPIRDESGCITEILCIGHDITDHEAQDRARISTAMWRDKVIGGTDVGEDVFDAVFAIGWEISREGREGHAVGTAFLVGDTENVLSHSKQLILNPFEGHRAEDRMITNPQIRENVKELAQLDGVFVIRGDGLIEAAARYITLDTSAVGIPKGLGTRHSSIAGMTQATRAIGIVISQSGGKITVFRNGKILQEIS